MKKVIIYAVIVGVFVLALASLARAQIIQGEPVLTENWRGFDLWKKGEVFVLNRGKIGEVQIQMEQFVLAETGLDNGCVLPAFAKKFGWKFVFTKRLGDKILIVATGETESMAAMIVIENSIMQRVAKDDIVIRIDGDSQKIAHFFRKNGEFTLDGNRELFRFVTPGILAELPREIEIVGIANLLIIGEME